MSSRSGLHIVTLKISRCDQKYDILLGRVNSRAYVDEDLAQNVDEQVFTAVEIVEGSVFSHRIAGGKQDCTEWVQSNELEAFVKTEGVVVKGSDLTMARIEWHSQTLPDMADR